MKDIKKTTITNLLVHLPIDITIIDNSKDISYESEYLNYQNILTNIEKDPEPFEEENNILKEEKINYKKK